MMQISLVLVFLLFAGSCQIKGQLQRVRGSGNLASETRELKDFDQVSVSGSADVYITLADEWHVEVITDDNILDYIETEVTRGNLSIGTKRGYSLRNLSKLEFHITAPAVYKLATSGSSDATFLSPVRQDEISLVTSGSSDIRLSVDVVNLDVTSSGSSDVHIEGYADNVRVTISGSGDFKGKNFECRVAEIRLSGSSDFWGTITESVSGRLSGSSDLRIKGNPAVDVRTSGSASVKSGW